MKPSKIGSNTLWIEEEDFQEECDFDVYSDFDEDDAIEHGMKPNEVAFLYGFKRSG
jgi:hypothetical protein